MYILQRILHSSSYSFFLIRVFLIVVIGFEFFFARIPAKQPQILDQSFSKNLFYSNKHFGHQMEAGQKGVLHTAIAKGDTVYSVLYCTDAFSRRVACTPDTNKLNSDHHAFFVGCSFTFGHGVNYEATIPALFQAKSPNYWPANLGCNGYGPHQNLMDIHLNLKEITNQKLFPDKGFMLYSFIDDHLNRVYSDIASQEIKFDKNGGWTLTKKWNWRKFIIWLNNNSRSMQYFKVRIAHPQTQGYYRYFAGIINAMASEYHRYYPENTFYVGYYPGEVRDTAWIKYCNQNIKFIKTRPPYDLNENYYDYHLQYDLHPTLKLNDYYVSYIFKNVQNN